MEESTKVRSAIQEIALGHRKRYGYRRSTAELRRRGLAVNHKRVAGRLYLDLASRLKIHGPNQLWVADMTYIQLRTEFVYLAVVLDAFSRNVVGWSLDRGLQARLPLSALRHAILNRIQRKVTVHPKSSSGNPKTETSKLPWQQRP
jgi:putative transposase